MKFQGLEDYQKLEEHLAYLKWNVQKTKLELVRWVEGDLATVRLEENLEKIGLEIELLESTKKEMQIIMTLFKGLDSKIVRMRYEEGCSLEFIAEKVGYSASYIRQRHAEIRKTIVLLSNYKSVETP